MSQGLRQASVRAVSGTTLTYEGDWHDMWDGQGIAAGTFNERMILYCNQKLGGTHTNINNAMQALAVDAGATNFGSMGTFTATIGGLRDIPHIDHGLPEPPPQIVSLNPPNSATNVDGTTDLVVTFDKLVKFGIGSVHLYDGADQHVSSLTAPGHVAEGVGGAMWIEGKVLTIKPANTMLPGERYYVLIDESTIIRFPGIDDKLVWNWKIALAARSTTRKAPAKKTPAKKK